MNDYISLKDTNSLIRKALKESFPNVKFSVRGKSYAGGASTTIRWTDGPNSDQVERLMSAFEGSYFDGMIDYKGSRYAWLDGEEVHFGADFLFCNRDSSVELETRTINRIANEYNIGASVDDIRTEYHQGRLYDKTPWGEAVSGMSPHSLQSTIGKALSKFTLCPFPQHSATLDRVAFKGDDGYGAGTVGPNGDGPGYGGYPSCQ